MTEKITIELEIKGEHLAGLRKLKNVWCKTPHKEGDSFEKIALETEAQSLLALAIWKGCNQLQGEKP